MSIRSWLCVLLVSLAASPRAAQFEAGDPAGVRQSVQSARPGDNIILRDGTWRDADLVFEANGTAEQPITLGAQTPGKVILTGKSRLRLSGQHLVVEGLWFKDGPAGGEDVIEFRTHSSRLASHCRVTQCAITDFNPATARTETKWVSLYGVSNRVDHCYFAGKQNAGTTLVVWVGDQPNHHRIDHNHFGPRPRLGQNGGETIRVGDSARSMQNSRTLVEHNLFDRCNGEAEIVSNKSCENIYRANTFLACEGTLTLRHGNRCVVEGNFFLGAGQRNTGGVRVIGEDHRVINNYFADSRGKGSRAALCFMNGVPSSPLNKYFQVKNALVAFNTFVGCAENVVVGLADERTATLPPTGVVIANNVFVTDGVPLVKQLEVKAALRWQGNFLHGAETGAGSTPGMRRDDPRLALSADGLWRPLQGSPVIGAAEGDLDDVREDMDGQPRIGRKDAGSDQRSDAPVKNRPLTAKDTGPAWLPGRN